MGAKKQAPGAPPRTIPALDPLRNACHQREAILAELRRIGDLLERAETDRAPFAEALRKAGLDG